MAEREYVWTDGALADTRRRKIALEEVVQALYAPGGLYYERRVGDLLVIAMGMADTGRVIAVFCERAESATTYAILRVRLLAVSELEEWRRRLDG